MPKFEETMENSRAFLTYSLAMTMLGKSTQVLAERGADPEAMAFITSGIKLLTKQLREYADQQDLEADVERDLSQICLELKIGRASVRKPN